MVTLTSGANTWLTLNGQPLRFADDDENLAANAIENHRNTLLITRQAPDDLQISIDDEPVETHRYGRWDWYPKDYAGLYTLEVSAPSYPLLTTKVRVLPSKLSQERYEAMLNEISEIATDLLFSLASPAGERAKIHLRGQQTSALRDYYLIQPMIYELGDIIAHIRRNPHRKLQEYTEQKLLHEVYQFSSDAVPVGSAMLALPERVASAHGMHYLPESWNTLQSFLTYDVYENRLLKHFVQRQLLTRLNAILERAMSEIKRREQNRKVKLRNGWDDDEMPKLEELTNIVEECHKMVKWCVSWKGQSFFTSVKSVATTGYATQVLLKNPFYSRFYRLYLQFQQELKISLDTEQYLTTLALRKMSDLYEIWSVFQITRMIIDKLTDEGYQITSQSFFYEVEQDNFQFDIRRNIPSITMAKDDFEIAIKYEPIFPKFVEGMTGLVSIDYSRLTPDMSVEVYHQGKVKHVIIFDAKYKFKKVDNIYLPKEEDLDKMRKYRDLIRCKVYNARDSRQKPQRIISSAYILYPGNHLLDDSHDPDEPEIGALPLVPKMTQGDRLDIENAIQDILWYAELL